MTSSISFKMFATRQGYADTHLSKIMQGPESIAYTSLRPKVGKFQNTNFYKTPWDDHKIYKINIFDNIDTGPGKWALNVNLLKDPTFMKTFEKEWIEFRKIKNEF